MALKINDESKHRLLNHIIGGITTNYFEFYCKKCGRNIRRLSFYGIDTVGVKVMAKCEECNKPYIFKIRTYPQLGPIQVTRVRGRNGFKAFDRRKLKRSLREIGHPSYMKGKKYDKRST